MWSFQFSVGSAEFRVDSLPFTVHHSLFTILHSPFSIPHSPFTILHSPFSILHSPFTIPHSPFPIHQSPFTIHHSPFPIHLPRLLQKKTFVSYSRRMPQSDTTPSPASSDALSGLRQLKPEFIARQMGGNVPESMAMGRDAQYRTYGIFQMTQLDTLSAR